MPQSRIDHQRARNTGDRAADQASRIQSGLVVVVGRSRVNLIVLSKIIERARMRPVSEVPEKAGHLIESCRPAIIVLDGGADLHECDAVLDQIMAQKRMSGGGAPFVIMLTPNNQVQKTLVAGGTIDAMVAKPLTPERLQPLIEQIRDRAAERIA